MRAIALITAAALLLPATRAAAQFPAELRGRVIEQGSAQPIAGAVVDIAGVARTATDGSGAFILRSADEGTQEVRVSQPGYAELTRAVVLESGRTTTLVLELRRAPVQLDALEVVAHAAPAEGVLFTREEIEASGARTLGDLLRAVPGVVVRAAAGAGERVSIRGGSADEVLVLVDGAALNDPLTGEADLSLVSLQAAESVRVLPGARSAREGARAQAGVILVETARAREGTRVSARVGSLGTLGLDADGGARVGALTLSAGGRLHRAQGDFTFDRPGALGGGVATRENASEHELGAFAAAALGGLRIRADHARAERGLPGPVHAPTPEATQEQERTSVSADLRAARGSLGVHARAHVAAQQVRYRDPAPPYGAAYFDTTGARDGHARLEVEHASGARVQRVLALGAEITALRLQSTALEPELVERAEPALFARSALELPLARFAPRLSLAARVDRWDGGWIGSHEVALQATIGPVTVDAAHRSAFSPPAAADQFFGSGFAIAPNPDLEPERVRAEVEIALSSAVTISDVLLSLGAGAFRGDIDGMIVWAPDFRSVWSPRNRDVKRLGGEAWARAALARGLDASAWFALARVTYDWPGDADTVQVVYRPRYSGGASLDWNPGAWRAGLRALYTGVRFATPGPSNSLPGYWDVDVTLGREWQTGSALIGAALRVERLLGNTDSFIDGYPEAGRRLELELSARPSDRHLLAQQTAP